MCSAERQQLQYSITAHASTVKVHAQCTQGICVLKLCLLLSAIISFECSSIEQATKVNRQANFFDRLAVLEARASLKTTLIWRLYLPVIFLSYGILLGE